MSREPVLRPALIAACITLAVVLVGVALLSLPGPWQPFLRGAVGGAVAAMPDAWPPSTAGKTARPVMPPIHVPAPPPATRHAEKPVKKPVETPPEPATPPIEIFDMLDLVDAFNAEVKADRDYKYRRVLVHAVIVESTRQESDGSFTVVFNVGNALPQRLYGSFPSSQQAVIAKLPSNFFVDVTGECAGKRDGRVWLTDCRITKFGN